MTAIDDPTWLTKLNQELKSLSTLGTYQTVEVLVLYWKDGGESYRDEGHAVHRMFQDLFHYNVTEFAIPSTDSYFHLLAIISQTLTKRNSGPALLIIHYGGHGDRDDDKHSGQERRSVWAAHNSGEPTLEWFKIQDQIKDSETDILLLLDCCYAAQAARHRGPSKGKFEILAAAAMGMETPAPGANSFTCILLQQIASEMSSGQRFVEIKDIHGQLCGRQQNLFATPVHVFLKSGHSPIRLAPLEVASKSAGSVEEATSPKSFFQLIVEIKQKMDGDSAEEVSRWLKADVPWIVSRLEVLERTESVGHAVNHIRKGSGVLGKRLRGSRTEDEIAQSWDNIVRRVEQYHDDSTKTSAETSAKRRKVASLLTALDNESGHIVDLIEENLLTSPILTTDGGEDDVWETISRDNDAQALGMVDQLRLCSMVRSSHSEQHESTPAFQSLPNPKKANPQPPPHTLDEVKRYGPYIDPSELSELDRRVHLLANLLKAPKAKAFRSLQCTELIHTQLTNAYTFRFCVPPSFAGQDHFSLSHLIQRTKGRYRPTLDERLRISHMLSRAVLKWHLVGWVHQGINSHNIIFFKEPGGDSTSKGYSPGRINYSEPFLHGLEFARPDSDPSIGRALDDIEFNVYRHPDRQGNARKGHQKKHDIYSLGVVLLEIGLWQNAVEMVRNKGQQQPQPAATASVTLDANGVARALRKNCTERLAHFAGCSYRDVVDLCLSSEFGVEVDDGFGSRLGKAFQGKVVDVLARGMSPY